MPSGKPNKPIACAYCGELFVPRCNKDRFHSTRCKLLGNTDKDGPVHPYRTELGRCWVWIAYKKRGYGRIHVDGKFRQASQVSYELFNGFIPEGHEIRHTCHNRACVNPAHLLTGTHQDNMDDMVAAGRQSRGKRHGRQLPRGEKHGGSKLTWRKVTMLRFLYSTGKFSQSRLARPFGTSQGQISSIVRGETWRAAS